MSEEQAYYKQIEKELMEKRKQDEEDYCDCHNKCPKCGKKIKPMLPTFYSRSYLKGK